MGVNKVEYGSSTLVDLTGDTVTPEALLSGYTAHNAAGEQILGTGSGGGGGSMEDTEKLIKQTVGWVSKNYINTTELESATDRGITWTVDPDTGVITANGTASGTGSNYSSFFLLNNNSQLMSLRELGLDPDVSYTLNGCPAGGSDNTYSIAIMSPSTIYVQDIGTSDGVTFKFSDYNVGLDDTIGILCIASPGTTLSDAEFKPMLMEYQFDKGYEPGHPPATEYFARYETIQILIEDKTYLTSIRNKNLGTKPTTEQMTKLANGDLTWAHNGDFWYDGTRYWEVLDNTLYLNRRGNTNYEKPHLIIKSRSNLISAAAYLISADGLTKGYAECAYRTRTDGKGRAQCKTIINNWLSGTNGQIASHYELMSTANDASGATAWAWQPADVEIESEVNVTGHINWGTAKYNDLTSSGKFNIGSQWGQFMLYRLAPYRAINRSENRWLRDLVGLSSTVPIFSNVRGYGFVDYCAASGTWYGLSPFFGLEAKS